MMGGKVVISLVFVELLVICIASESNTELYRAFTELFNWRNATPTVNVEFSARTEDLPDLDFLTEIPRDGFFWGMSPSQNKVVAKMKNILVSQPSAEQAILMAAKLREKPEMNPVAWFNAVVAAKLHRNDMNGFRLPSPFEILPGNFFPGEIIEDMIRNPDRKAFNDPEQCDAVVNGDIGSDNGEENVLWYFREDVFLNSLHWYWHLTNPIDAPKGTIDRKGELFYYFHHSAMARYKTERIMLGMKPVEMYDGLPGSIITLGYNPHLIESNSARNWTVRPAGRPTVDLKNGILEGTPIVINLEARATNIKNVLHAIDIGSVTPADDDDMIINLEHSDAIDILGSLMEASLDSINPDLFDPYGIHNSGHNLVSLVEDPEDTLHLPPGVMGESSTAMRDPMFYCHHSFIDSIMVTHLDGLEPYKLSEGEWPLLLAGVTLESIQVRIIQMEGEEVQADNVLRTFFDTTRYDLSKGLDFNRTQIPGPLYICHEHLNYKEFEYSLQINREDVPEFAGKVNVRIYLGPQMDKDGNEFNLEQIRKFMFVMDTFTVDLEVGNNTITRNSKDSPLTINIAQGLGESEFDDPKANFYCGCGWPDHMLVPRGTVDGFPFDLFAILTDAAEDTVEEEPESTESPPECKEAYIYCGVLNSKYPDKRPMGWPFDRRISFSEEVTDPKIADFGRLVPNAAHSTIKIFHTAATVTRTTIAGKKCRHKNSR